MRPLGRIDSKRFERYLIAIGCRFVSQESSHRKFKKEGILRPIIVPFTDDLPDFIILNNLRTLGVKREDFIRIIRKL